MGEILPDGSIQGYFTVCSETKKDIEVNMQGTPRKKKHKKCTAQKGEFACTVWDSPYCNDCALYK